MAAHKLLLTSIEMTTPDRKFRRMTSLPVSVTAEGDTEVTDGRK